jgi:hypothetical protein
MLEITNQQTTNLPEIKQEILPPKKSVKKKAK